MSEFHINYKPKTAIKAQALADFVAESTHQPDLEFSEEGIHNSENDLGSSGEKLDNWTLFVDGSSNQHRCGAGLVLQTPEGEQMEYAIRIGFKVTNNEAEYEALLAGLRVATRLGVQSIEAYSDSQLVANQVQGDYLARDVRMAAYLDEVKCLTQKIKRFTIRQIPRKENRKADALANLTSTFDLEKERQTIYHVCQSCYRDVHVVCGSTILS